jgi:poly(A) polymerase
VQKVLRRLVRGGHEAYLVGGCVRDLLLDRRPKDFDVATSARPEEVRELFRNSRIIGRRFRLVHVLFQGGKVIEVATFRRSPKEETDDATLATLNGGAELLIRSDNVFGVASEDALRRDFTINALFYDFEKRQILDWVGGMEDVRRRVVHTIGDPETRFREDPVRILRALKFAGRLDLGITPDVYDAVVYCRESLALAARPRLSEEILRLLRGGQARRTIYLAWETGVLEVLLPELAALLYDDGEEEGPGHRVWRLLDYIDKRTAEDGPLDDTVLWTLLLLEPMKEACDGARDRAAAVADFLEPLIERIAISRRYADGMRRIVSVLPRLVSGRAGRFARTEMFQLAVEVAAAELRSRGEPTEAVDRLRSTPLAARSGESNGAPRPPRSHRERYHNDGGRGRR